MKCLCWPCSNEAAFGQGRCSGCLKGCLHAIPTEKRRVDFLVADPAYQAAIDRVLRFVALQDRPAFSGEMAKLMLVMVDHGIRMGSRQAGER